MSKLKFYLNLIYLCGLESIQDALLKTYLLQYATDSNADLKWLEEGNFIGYDVNGVPFLTPKGFEALNNNPAPRGFIKHRNMNDGLLVQNVVQANKELCRRYQKNDTFCEKVHGKYRGELISSIQCLVDTVTTADAVVEEDYLVAAQESLDNN